MVAREYGVRDSYLRRSLAVGDAFALGVALIGVGILTPDGDTPSRLAWGFALLPVWIVLLKVYGLYDRDAKRLSHTTLDDSPAVFHVVLLGSLMLWIYFKVIPVHPLNGTETLAFGALAFLLILFGRAMVRRLIAKMIGPEPVLLVGDTGNVNLMSKLQAHPEYNANPVGAIRKGEVGDAAAVLEQAERLGADRLIVAHEALEADELVKLLHACKAETIKVSLLPRVFDVMGPSVEIDDVEGVTVLGVNPPVLTRSSRLMKRATDIAGSALGLIVTAPFMALIAAAIKLDSQGPVFFRQSRVGKNGEPFELIKFRTMVLGADQQTALLRAHSTDPRWLKLDHDPRITRVGRVLRRSSLDELPQLGNVLRGHMSLVGPRPLSDTDDSQVGGQARSRLDLTPGLTGLWQVLGRTGIPFDEMIKLDYLYVTNWSLWTDLRLLLQTIPAVFARRGAN